MKLISISVAAYNVEAFIRQCLDSFVNSGVLEEVEVIVTDDGSRDSTPDIVLEYESKYPGSIRLIRQPNAGPGSTVNSGIRHATGKYFRMVDGDDWVNPEEFARFVAFLRTTDTDAVLHDYAMVDHDTAEKVPCPLSGIEAGRVYPLPELAPKMSISMHNFVVRTSLMKEHVELFPCFYTDMQYLVFPTRYIRDAVFYPCEVYQYRVSLGTQSMNPLSLQKNIAMHERVLDSLIRYYREYEASEEFDPAVGQYVSDRILRMAGCQLSTYLSFPPSREAKKVLKDFFSYVKREAPFLAPSFFRLRTVRLMTHFSFLYRPFCRWHRRRLGL